MKQHGEIFSVTLMVIFSLSLSSSNAYYRHLTETDDEKNMRLITGGLRLVYNSPTNQSDFPPRFSLNFTEFDISFCRTFVRLGDQSARSQPGVYVLDQVSQQPRLVDSIREEKNEFYREVNGLGFATLIKNSNQTLFGHDEYRMIGTIYLNETYGMAFDIIPVVLSGQDETRRQKRDTDYNNGLFHGLFRRPIDDSSSKLKSFSVPASSSFRVSSDFAEVPKEGSTKNGFVLNLDKIEKPFRFNVELLVVTDTSLLADHKRYTKTDQLDLVFFHMKIYYLHLLNGVNQRYQNTFENDTDIRVNIIPTNFLFLTNSSDQSWTKSNMTSNTTGREVLISTETLARFKEFLEAKKFPFNYDLALGLFNKDLWSENTQFPSESRAAVSGFAYIGTVCTDHKYAVAEDFGGFSNLVTVAHEIGHNLGSYHDGEIDGYGNCTAQDNYIMTSSLSFQNALNLLRFSSCSVNQFKKTLLNSNKDQIISQASCLINSSSEKAQAANIELVNEELPGQIWTANDQCQMIYGPGATFCQFASNQICTLLYCRANTSSDGMCNAKVGGAMEGTTCASGKICLQGKCVESAKAPTGDCLFGDEVITQQSISIPLESAQVTCQQAFDIIESRNQSASGYCADSYFRGMCCQSCKKFDQIKCRDMFYDCPKLGKSCDNLIVNGVLVRNLCPSTCGTCPHGVSESLNCQNGASLCQNKAVCRNRSKQSSSSSSSSKSLIAFECVCPVGFSGDFCEKRNPCLPNPCKNGGKCLQLGSSSYACNCPQNCSGMNCSVCSFVTTTSLSTSTSKKPIANKLDTIITGLIKTTTRKHKKKATTKKTITTTTTTETPTTTKAIDRKLCQNLSKSFCVKFRTLTKCQKDYTYLGVSLKSYCCEICL